MKRHFANPGSDPAARAEPYGYDDDLEADGREHIADLSRSRSRGAVYLTFAVVICVIGLLAYLP